MTIRFIPVRPRTPVIKLPVDVTMDCATPSPPTIRIFKIPVAAVTPNTPCLKGLYKTTFQGAVVLLCQGGFAWGIGVLVDKARRRDDTLYQAVAVLTTVSPGTDVTSVPRWCQGRFPCYDDAFVPILSHALKYTPHDAALDPFYTMVNIMNARNILPEFTMNILSGHSFTFPI